jgi:hypothetical protein
MHGRIAILIALAALGGAGTSGCDASPVPTYFGTDEAPPPPAPLAADFDPSTAGTIAGRVIWEGAAPRVPPLESPVSPLSEQPTGQRLFWPNPLAPAVDPASRGVAGAVVFLRGVDPRRARPWDHPPVRVAVRDFAYHVRQGGTDALTGFVRRGDRVSIVADDDRFQAVRARGAAFFTLALAERDHSQERALAQTGVVEFSSNAGQFWMRAHLFVADHPYLARTDALGRFSLEQVPAGAYELASWLPNWHEASHELDGETALVSRLTFRPSVVKLRDMKVAPGAHRTVDFSYREDDFGK